MTTTDQLTNEHFTDFVVLNADVQTVSDFQRCFVQLRDDRMVGFRSCVNDPQTIIVCTEVDDVELRCVEVLCGVDVLKWFDD